MSLCRLLGGEGVSDRPAYAIDEKEAGRMVAQLSWSRPLRTCEELRTGIEVHACGDPDGHVDHRFGGKPWHRRGPDMLDLQ